MSTTNSNSKLITDNFKQVKKRNQPSSSETKDYAEPSTSSHLQPNPDPELEMLKQFDLTLEYGPCTGITRLQRWERAHKHGLNPPPKVKEILSHHQNDETYTKNLWKDYNI